MSQVTFSGVRNLDQAKPKVQACDGVPYEFDAGEVKVLPSEIANFLVSRIEVLHKRDEKGNFLGVPEGRRVFELVPLHEALKVAKLDENPSIKDARRKEREESEKRAALVSEIKAALQADGWQPPKQKASKSE